MLKVTSTTIKITFFL